MNHRRQISGLLILSLMALLPLRLLADDDGTPLKSRDGEIQLALPSGWVAVDIQYTDWQLEASDNAHHVKTGVGAESSKDVAVSLTDYARRKRDRWLNFLRDATADDGQQMQISNFDAVQYQIHGTNPTDGLKIGCVLTVISMRTHFVQVFSWCAESRFDENEAIMGRISEDVSETNNSGQ